MVREVTLTQLLSWMLAFVGSVAALSWACLMFLTDREQGAAVFATGGLALLLWASSHVTDRPRRHG